MPTSSIVSVLTRIPNLCKTLTKTLPAIEFHEVTQPSTDRNFRKSHIIIGDYDLLGPFLYELPNAKWVQGTWAGLDYLLKHILRNEDGTHQPLPFRVTRFSGRHFGQLMGEYVLANIVNWERGLFRVRDNQRERLWMMDGIISEYRALNELTVGILGLGNIGNRIGKMLSFMGASVVGYGRAHKSDYDYLSGFYTKDTLAYFLATSDYIVNVLPNTPETTNLLGHDDILRNCTEKNSVFINIGRGSIISDEALIKALNNKWISGAILDVFNQEPLEQESPLWTMPQVFITPHTSGRSRALDVAEQFRDNLKLYMDNKPIPATVDLKKGY